MSTTAPPSPTAANRPGWWQRAGGGAMRLFHVYGRWLVGISWLKFAVLAILLLISAELLSQLPPFNIPIVPNERLITIIKEPPAPPLPPRSPPRTRVSISDDRDDGVQISIDKDGVRILRSRPRAASSAAAAASAASAATAIASAAVGAGTAAPEAAASAARRADDEAEIIVRVPAGASSEVRRAIEDAREAVAEAVREAKEEAREAATEEAAGETAREIRRLRRQNTTRIGDAFEGFAFLWIIASAILKIAYKGRVQAEVQAQAATETAESEQLKRQVVEARMAAMQAQVEPHFLFNTLASIDHLIQADPARASQMQRNLIAMLRASMPTMREQHPAGHNLGREIDVVRPYVEILKVRMEDRLQATIDVPEGLRSAEFPAMVMQSLVENAIKHGLEPKAEGGSLAVRAEIVDGRLAVSVADTGLGFGRAPTAGTGTGLANIRERLKLLYGDRASLTVEANEPAGTVVTVAVPYRAGTAAA